MHRAHTRSAQGRTKRLRRRYALLCILHPNIGKAKLHVLLPSWCGQHGPALRSESTIGRIIAHAPLRCATAPRALIPGAGPCPANAAVQATQTQGRTHRAAPVLGGGHDRTPPRWHAPIYRLLHRPAKRLGLRVGHTSKHARHTRAALQATFSLLPTNPQLALSDNGSEFEGKGKFLPESRYAQLYPIPSTNPATNLEEAQYMQPLIT